MNNSKDIQTCCPEFDPKPWDKKIFQWEKKKFIKARVLTLFYIPINFGGIMKKLDSLIQSSKGKFEGALSLAEHTSKWNMNILVAVDKDITNAENVEISGNFISKVYQGDFSQMSKWTKDFDTYTKNKRLDIIKQYMWYTTCPKCAKKYGKNYVVILGEFK